MQVVGAGGYCRFERRGSGSWRVFLLGRVVGVEGTMEGGVRGFFLLQCEVEGVG